MSQKKTPCYAIRITQAQGYHLAPISVGRNKRRSLQAYECMGEGSPKGCEYNFRVDCSGAGKHGTQIVCPKCGSLYVEWLSYDVAAQDVYLSTEQEWAECPEGSVRVTRQVGHADVEV